MAGGGTNLDGAVCDGVARLKAEQKMDANREVLQRIAQASHGASFAADNQPVASASPKISAERWAGTGRSSREPAGTITG